MSTVDDHSDSFLFTKAGIVIPMVTGSMSFLSSLIIISIVLRSMSGVKTTYHRIILGLSFADCLTSFAIALTTIPMPKDVIYPFQMPSYGSIATCEAQGLVYMIGNGLVFGMNGILNIYYLCTLRYNMPENIFRRYLEIPLCIANTVISITVPSATLIKEELLNPSPTDPYCVPNTYPVDCTKADNPECRGGGGRGAFNPMYLSVITLAFFTLIITMALVVHSFYRNERKLRKAVKDNQIHEGDETYQVLQRAQETSGIITRQAVLYIAAFLITWIFGFVEFCFKETGDDTKNKFLPVLRMIFQPLQGFFNLIIFVYHKVQTLRRADDDLTVVEALEKVFLFPDQMEDKAAVSNLNIVIDQFVLDQIRSFEDKRAAFMNLENRRIHLDDSAVVGRGDFDNSGVATMSGLRHSKVEVSSPDGISPLQPAVAAGSSIPVPSSQSNHGGVSIASSATSVFISRYKGPFVAMHSRNKGVNNVATTANVAAEEIPRESFNDDVRTINDGLSGFSFSSVISNGSADEQPV